MTIENEAREFFVFGIGNWITKEEAVAYGGNIAASILRSIELAIITVSSGGEKDRCLLYTSPSPRDRQKSRMPSSA